MTTPLRWPSVPRALTAVLRDKFGVEASTRLPGDFQPPVIQVSRIGGQDDGFLDHARVDVVVIHVDEVSAENLAEDIRTFLIDTKPIRGAGLLLEGASTEVAPYRAPYPYSANPDWTQYLATYVIESRRA